MNYGKILIKGKIEVVTGLHIGGTESYSAIGAVDSPVIRDTVSGNPIIPGSSIKGKMRYLLQRTYGASSEHSKDNIEVLRLFGCGGDSIIPSRLQFSDCFINKESLKELKSANIRLTEVKTENSIDRRTSKAMPRQIERVIRGTIFDFELIYNVLEENELAEDIKNISLCMKLLSKDYLGGNGSRGSGRIIFKDIDTENIYGDFGKIELEV